MVKTIATTTKKDKFYIEDYTEADKKNVKKSALKKKVRDALRENIQKSINRAKHKDPESNIHRLKRIFSLNGEDETIITIRYGTIIFYQGKVSAVRIFNGNDEDYDAKMKILEHLTKMIDDNKWFNDQYNKYLKIKEGADAKSAKTKASSKKVATKASAKKSMTKKTSAKKVGAKASAKKTTSKIKSKKN